jgi:hypothetical protein
MALGSLCSVATGCRASRSVKRSKEAGSTQTPPQRVHSSSVTEPTTMALRSVPHSGHGRAGRGRASSRVASGPQYAQ